MNELTIETLEAYLYEIYSGQGREQSLFMKLVEEVGEVAEVLNIRAGRKSGTEQDNDALAKELVDVIHYAAAIAAINRIDLAAAIVEKDKQAAVKYSHPINLETFMDTRAADRKT